MAERKRVDSFKVKHLRTGTMHDVFVYETVIDGHPMRDYETNSGQMLRRVSEKQFEMPVSKARFTRA